MEVNIDGFARELVKQLKEYTSEIAAGVKEAADTTAKELLENIRADAPDRTGWYKAHMRIKTVKEDAFGKKIVWYVHGKKSNLTHLLEHGHALKRGGRVRAYPHIAPNEEKAKKAFTERVKEVIEDASG